MTGLDTPAPYRDRMAALLTQHGKEQVIGPVLEAALGCFVQRVTGFDTDQLGTFTREIPRVGTQIEAARRKARIGMTLSSLPLGLASEGAFGPDPMIGMLPWNVEYLIWIDDVNQVEVVGRAQGKACFAHLLTSNWTEAESFARQWSFPDNHLVVRPNREDDPCIQKGIAQWAALESAFHRALSEAECGKVFLETDVRAHANPTRQQTIRAATEDLAARLSSACPACGAPGFWLVDRVTGLPCSDCGAPTQETMADIQGCVKCSHRLSRERSEPRYADPGRCDYCNP